MNTHTQFRRHKDREKISLQESLLRTGKRDLFGESAPRISPESLRQDTGPVTMEVQTASRPKPAPVYPADTFYRGNLDLSETEQIRRADTAQIKTLSRSRRVAIELQRSWCAILQKTRPAQEACGVRCAQHSSRSRASIGTLGILQCLSLSDKLYAERDKVL